LGAVRAALPKDKVVLGFAGAPWTLAAYMIEGKGSPDQRAAKKMAYGAPQEFAALIDLLSEAVSAHLCAQLEAGADAVQIFDSWAGGLPPAFFARWVIEPTRTIVREVRRRFPDAKIIGFPRAAT